jgi:alpha-glucosidase
VVYQIYPRSFMDSNDDGLGDIGGIIERLDYIDRLGVDAVWICPWYSSPLRDGGYDVSDYRMIDPRLGSNEDAVRFIAECHARDLRVIVDIVPNHTSSEHAWFRDAVSSPSGSAARAMYHFQPGRGEDGSLPPNDWTSVFGGSAWTRLDDGEWYLHLFNAAQPDLNWSNEVVRREFDEILRFWLDLGVDGFRVDVAHGLIKASYSQEVAFPEGILETAHIEDHPYWNRPEIHDINRRWRAVLDEYGGGRMMLAEAWVAPAHVADYLRPDEYHQTFNFDLLTAAWDADTFRTAIRDGIAATEPADGLPTWTLSNHDFMRPATRYGLPPDTDLRRWPLTGPISLLDTDSGLRRARAALLLVLALPGAAYVYQGEELGLPEYWSMPTEALHDPVWTQSRGAQKGRDGCRAPMPWDHLQPNCGFSRSRPWLPQPDEYAQMAVSVQSRNGASTLTMVREALTLRRSIFASGGRLEWLSGTDEHLSFRRGNSIVITNFGERPIRVDSVVDSEHTVLIASTEPLDGMVQRESTVWIRVDDQ